MKRQTIGCLLGKQELRALTLAFAAVPACAIVVALAGTASAEPAVIIDPDDANMANGITNLDVFANSTSVAIFDVEFVVKTFSELQADGGAPIYDLSLPGSASPMEWGTAVVETIADTLNDYNDEFSPIVRLVGPNSANDAAGYYVPYEDGTGNEVRVEFGNFNSDGNFWSSEPRVDIPVDTEFMFASLTVVPEPGSLLLFAVGLLGVGALHRK